MVIHLKHAEGDTDDDDNDDHNKFIIIIIMFRLHWKVQNTNKQTKQNRKKYKFCFVCLFVCFSIFPVWFGSTVEYDSMQTLT